MTVVTVEAFLCDSVEGVGGKLYALGMGWNMISAAQFPARHSRIGIGIVIHVPYTSTNQMHEFFVHLETEDGVPLTLGEAAPENDPRTVENGYVVRLGGQFNVGRPADLPHGDEQLITFALQLDGIEFPTPGRYAVVVSVDGTETSRLAFRLRQVQQVQVQLPPS